MDELDWLPQKDEWKNLKSIVMVVSERLLPDQPPSIEKRYYLSSLPACALNIARAIRSHWGIESVPQTYRMEAIYENRLTACA